jgi:hypothetical protein
MDYMYITTPGVQEIHESDQVVLTNTGLRYKDRVFPTQARVFDLFEDLLIGVVELWTLEDHTVYVYRDNTIDCFQVSGNERIHVLDRYTCIVVGDHNNVYHKGVFQMHYERGITKTCFLYDINKYIIQNERDFIIVNRWDDPDPMIFTHDGSPIAFYAHQHIVLYIHRNHLCVAETDIPYRILVKRIPKLRYKAIRCTPDHIVLTDGYYNVFFSMFPMSFTDSTRILTTLE